MDFEGFLKQQPDLNSSSAPAALPAQEAVTPPEAKPAVRMEPAVPLAFESFMRQTLATERRQTLQTAQAVSMANVNSGITPQVAGESARLGRELQLPQAAVEADPALFKQQAREQRNATLLETHPALARWVSANPDSARIAQDEYDKLSTAERLWDGTKKTAWAGATGFASEWARLGSIAGMATSAAPRLVDWARGGTEAQDWWFRTLVDPWEQRREALKLRQEAGLMEKGAHAVGSLLSSMIEMGLTGPESQALKASAGVTETLKQALTQTTGSMAFPSLTAAYETGKDVFAHTGDALKASNAAAGAYMTSVLQGIVPVAAPGSLATRLATGALGGTVGGEAQRVMMNPLLPEAMRQSFNADDAIINALTGALLGGAMGPRKPDPLVADAVRRTYQEAALAERTVDDVNRLTRLGEEHQDLQLKRDDPAAYQRFIETMTEDSRLDAVYVDGGKLAEAFAQTGFDAKDLPEVARQTAEAVMAGGDVRIPAAEYAARIQGTPLEQAILPELKVDPEGMTFAESEKHLATVKETMKERAARLAEERQKRTEWEDDLQTVHDNVFEQLKATKRQHDAVSRIDATLMSEVYSTLAKREGMKPSELFKMLPLKVVAEKLTGERFAQATESPEFKQWFGESKVVGEDGQPLVVYHGTIVRPDTDKVKGMGDITAFDRLFSTKFRSPSVDTMGSWFSTNPGDGGAAMYSGNYPGSAIYPVHLSIKNPQETTFHLLQRRARLLHNGKDDGRRLGEAEVNAYRQWLRDIGKDGIKIVHDEGADNGSTEFKDQDAWIALEPEQIKSALGNRGTFDPNDANILNQAGPGEKLGEYSPANRTIALLKNANLSTFLHESGHFFLDTLGQLTARAEASSGIKDDFKILLDWFGVDSHEAWHAMSVNEQRAHHEKFAEGFETYLMEGKAPSAKLQPLFQRFRAWLLDVYRRLRAPDVELTPEVRGVMDRLLASEDAIREAEAVRSYKPLFGEKPPGLPTEEWNRYLQQGEAATQASLDEMQASYMKDLKWASRAKSKALRDLQRQADAARREVEGEVDTELALDPGFQAQEYLRSIAEKVDPDTLQAWTAGRETAEKAARESLKAALYAQHPDAKGLERGHLLARNRKAIEHQVEGALIEWERSNPRPRAKTPVPDIMAAEALGFDSVDAMMRAAAEAGNRADVMASLVDQRMLQQHGELVEPKAIEDAANRAVHNEDRSRFLAAGLKILTKSPLSAKAIHAAARDAAAETISRKKVMELRSDKFLAAEGRFNREALKLVPTDPKAAAEAQRSAVLNNRLAKAAMDAQVEVERGVKFMHKALDSGSIDPEFKGQIESLLGQYDLTRTTSAKEVKARESVKEFLARKKDEGYDPPDLPDAIIEALGPRHYKDLTVEEFRGLVDTVKTLRHMGMEKTKLLTAQKAEAWAVVRDRLEASIVANAGDREVLPRSPATALGRAGAFATRMGAEHIKAQTLIRVLDGGRDGGPLWEVLGRPANERGDRETTMRAKVTKDLHGIMQPVLKLKEWKEDPPEFKSINRSLTREQVFAMALNAGNEGNLQRLLGGEGWTSEQLFPVLSSLSRTEWQAVQKIWDYFETLWPEIEAKETRLYGKAPKRVEARPFVAMTADGPVEMKGGYYPVKYDPIASKRAEQQYNAEMAERQLKGAYTSATTQRSFTKPRAEEVEGRPLLYSLNGLYSGFNDVIHDLAWHEWLIDANRVMRSDKIDQAIRTRYGAEVVNQMQGWINAIAEGERGLNGALDGALGRLRHGVSIAGLAFNVMSAAMQPLGITQSMVRVGTPWVAGGVGQYLAHPVERTREVNAKSEFMTNRSRNRFRELNELRNQIEGHNAVKENVGRYGYWLMMKMQQAVDVPTWLGAYDKATAEGSDDKRAVALADQAVIDSQGSGQVKDLSAIERGGQTQKLFTVFYSFMNTALNVGVGQTMTANTPAKKAKLAVDYLMLYTVPAVLGAALKDALTPGDSGDWDDGKVFKKLAAAQLEYLMGLMVVAREFSGAGKKLFNLADNVRDYSGPAGLRIVSDAQQLAGQVGQLLDGGEFDTAFRKAMVNFTGDLVGLPAAQINRTITGAEALKEGKTSNPLALAFGYQEPQ